MGRPAKPGRARLTVRLPEPLVAAVDSSPLPGGRNAKIAALLEGALQGAPRGQRAK